MRGSSFLSVLIVLALWTIAGTGSSRAGEPFDLCKSSKYEAERYLRPIGTFDFLETDPPPCQLSASPLPIGEVPSSWWLESLVLLALAIGLGGAAFLLQRRAERVPATILALMALTTLTLAGENALAAGKINDSLRTGHEAVASQDFEAALASLKSAARRQSSALLPKIGWDGAVARPEIGRIQESAGICAVEHALEGDDTSLAVRYLDDFPIATPEGRAAHRAALTWDAGTSLARGDTANALQQSERALGLEAGSETLQANAAIARYHHAVASVQHDEPESALELAKLLDAPGSGIPKRDREAVRGFAARAVAKSFLADPRSARPAQAVATLEEAHAYALEGERRYPFIDCDLAGALEADAILKLAARDAGPAVAALDRSDELVPGRQMVRELRPRALLVHGNQLLSERRFPEAITKLERAFDETGGRDKTIREALGLAWFSSGADAHQQDRLDAAIDAYHKTVEILPRDPNVRFSLGEALLQRSDQALKTGQVAAAGKDLKTAAESSAQHREAARQRLQYLPGMSERLRAIRSSSSWLDLPDVVGEVPRDLDQDGRIDRFAYYTAASGSPAAVARPVLGRRPPRSLALVSSDSDGETVAIVRDINGDGRFDERATYEDGDIEDLWTDVDGDFVPDVRGIEFRHHAFEFQQQSLSGRVVLQMKGGVIGAAQDFFSDPDAYLKLIKNSRYVGSTSTAQDTYYPTWNEGIVLDYKYRDRVRLEIWDEDLFSDDFIDSYETTELPRSGIYQFAGRKAAVEIDVWPSRLPEGHHVVFEAPAEDPNIFRDHPTAVPEVADILAGARQAEATTRAIQWVTKAVVTQVLLPRLLPDAGPWQLFVAELVVENVVLDPAMGIRD